MGGGSQGGTACLGHPSLLALVDAVLRQRGVARQNLAERTQQRGWV